MEVSSPVVFGCLVEARLVSSIHAFGLGAEALRIPKLGT